VATNAPHSRRDAPARQRQDSTEYKKNSFRDEASEIFGARGGPLLLLRMFLGFTFSFASLQKLANPNFFKSSAPGSFTEQLRGSVTTSPLHHLLSPALHAPTLVALVIAFAELAVGLGTLLGLFGRTAALGGLALSLTFFLVVSFHDRPYYYGPDIVFLFAWTPLAISGSGRWSLDDYYDRKREAVSTAKLSKTKTAELDRRVVLQRGIMAGSLALFGLVTGGITAALGRILNTGSSSTRSAALAGNSSSPANNSGAASSGVSSSTKNNIGPSKVVPLGGAASFTDPITGSPGLVVHPSSGSYLAYSAICPHTGCQVQFDQQAHLFVCPCHGSEFNGTTGAVILGPAATGLTAINIKLDANGDVIVEN